MSGGGGKGGSIATNDDAQMMAGRSGGKEGEYDDDDDDDDGGGRGRLLLDAPFPTRTMMRATAALDRAEARALVTDRSTAARAGFMIWRGGRG
jgi:hypothetical protein